MRDPSAEEIEDARVETLMDHRERDRLTRSHRYNPECGCAEWCNPPKRESDEEMRNY